MINFNQIYDLLFYTINNKNCYGLLKIIDLTKLRYNINRLTLQPECKTNRYF